MELEVDDTYAHDDVYVFPLSPAQQRLWFQYQFDPQNPYYNIPYVFRASDKLDPDTLERAVQDVIQVHEGLRTLFGMRDDKPVQIVHGHLPVPLERIDLTAAGPDGEKAGLEHIDKLSREPYVLETGPLVRCVLVRLHDGHLFYLGMHHIISDFTSCRLFLRDLSTAYQARLAGRAPEFDEVPIQYPDFALWHSEWLETPQARKQIAEWSRMLEAAQSPLELSIARPRPPVQQFRGKILRWLVDEPTAATLRDLSRRESSSLFMTMLTVLNVLLGRYSDRDDIVIATAPSGRSAVEIEQTIGFFVNTIPLRMPFDEDSTFRQALHSVRDSVSQSLSLADVPFDVIVREVRPDRSLGFTPIAQVAFVLHHSKGLEVQFADETLVAVELDNRSAKFDITMCIFDHGDVLECFIEYDSDLFSEESMNRFTEYYRNLANAIHEYGADTRLRELSLLTAAQQQALVSAEDAHTDGEAATDHSVPELVRRRAEELPDEPAVVTCDQVLTRAQLMEGALTAATALRRHHAGPETAVAVCLPPVAELATVLLGILWTGAAYTLLDPADDSDWEDVLADLGSPLIVAAGGPAHDLAELGFSVVSPADLLAPGRAPITDLEGPLPGQAALVHFGAADASERAVAVSHSAVVMSAQALDAATAIPDGPELVTAAALIARPADVLAPLMLGRVLALAEDTSALTVLSAQCQVATARLTARELRSTADGTNRLPEGVETVLLSGPAERELLNGQGPLEGIRVISRYAPLAAPLDVAIATTAATGWSAGEILAGTALPGFGLHVMTDDLAPTPPGLVGEVVVSGTALSGQFAYDEPAATAQTHVPNPHASAAGSRLYRTGELGRICDDGNLELVGRAHADLPSGATVRQTRLRKTLLQHPAVSDAVVLWAETGDEYLAFVAASPGENSSAADLREYLSAVVGTATMPSGLRVSSELPRTVKGTIDVARLICHGDSDLGAASASQAGSPYESEVIAVFERLLGTRGMTSTSDFFAFGGHSMLAARAALELGRATGVLLPVRAVFENATVSRMATYLAWASAEGSSGAPRRNPEPESRPDRQGPGGRVPAASRPRPASYQLGDVNLSVALERQVARTPGHVAVSDGTQSVTYSELWGHAGELAGALHQLGAGPERLVAILVDRSVEQVEAIVGVLRSGAGYVPLDPASPDERLRMLVQQTRPVAVVASRQLLPRLNEVYPGFGAPVLVIEPDGKVSDPDSARPVVGMNATPERLEPDAPAYVIFTSGSTGQPKGVCVTHRNVVRLVEQAQEHYRFDDQDVWSMFHSYGFDVSVFEMWGALLNGGRVAVVPYWVSRSPDEFYDFLAAERVTVLSQTPSAFSQLILAAEIRDADPADLSLRYVIFAGERLDVAALQPWFARFGDETPTMVNMYGITEVTVHATFGIVRAADAVGGDSAIGSPLGDLDLVLLDDELARVPVGEVGEIYVAGLGLARGYFDDPARTADRFVPNPFPDVPGTRLYRSGDLAVRSPEGRLVYCGRIDNQVKVRGFRIELGEIEQRLLAHPDIVAAAAGCIRQADDLRLVAFVVPSPGYVVDLEELRAFAAEFLPPYMVPNAIRILRQLPLTANGKVDRASLVSGWSSADTGAAAPTG
ncbi:amino acid adenylation domain-containing protein [Streptomyces sp. NPDC015350]|uniref:amino acid adenylation domain-containing protein n=1 Tax=Streptomyces sp. NPDC015350 TaxID=3364955 RepID=UPI0036FDD340